MDHPRALASITPMEDFEFHPADRADGGTRELVIYLREQFDAIIDGLEPSALKFLRQQVAAAERTPANLEILVAIDRRLAGFRGGSSTRN